MAEGRNAVCDICGGALGQQRWRGFPPICTKCEMEAIHDTPGLSGPYVDTYARLRDIRNMLADTFRYLESEAIEVIEGEPIADLVYQIEDITQTFIETTVKPMDAEWAE